MLYWGILLQATESRRRCCPGPFEMLLDRTSEAIMPVFSECHGKWSSTEGQHWTPRDGGQPCDRWAVWLLAAPQDLRVKAQFGHQWINL
mmetsp:Transcript_15062/g.25577  ORF Transcript_15062/g.25577 Transcript_15062/m.25577 type:complete len:89 (-) Transcript_15062:8-274(-)